MSDSEDADYIFAIEDRIKLLMQERDQLKAELEEYEKLFEERGILFQNKCNEYLAQLETLKMRLGQCNTENQNVHKENLALEAQVKAWKEDAERFANAAKGLSFGKDWNKGTHALKHGYRQKLLNALESHEKLKAKS